MGFPLPFLHVTKSSEGYMQEYFNLYIATATITIIMATITLRMEVEERLIEAGIERKKWAEYTNRAVLSMLGRGKGGKEL